MHKFLGFIKCPLCGNLRGYKVLQDFKYWFWCHQCGLKTPLKLLHQYGSVAMKEGEKEGESPQKAPAKN